MNPSFPVPDPDGSKPLRPEISKHAAARWMQRTGIRDPGEARAAWDEAWDGSREVFLKPEHRLKTLLVHGLKDARYFRSSGGWVFVLVGDGTVATVHSNTADKYLDKPAERA